MLESHKTEINPTLEQTQRINKTIGTCRLVYNFNLARNKEVHEKEKKSMSGMDFSRWLNDVYLKENPEYVWIKEVSSKSVKQSTMNFEREFRSFFKGQSGFPKFKKKDKSDGEMQLVKIDPKVAMPRDRHRTRTRMLAWVR